MTETPKRSRLRAVIILCTLALAACDKPPPPGYQGYVEGESVGNWVFEHGLKPSGAVAISSR